MIPQPPAPSSKEPTRGGGSDSCSARDLSLAGRASDLATPGNGGAAHTQVGAERGRGGWNYRVFRHENPDGSGFYMIHEAYYRDAKVNGWTEDGAAVCADTSLDLLSVIAMFADALGHPILDAKTGEEIEPARELSDDLRRVVAMGKTDLFEADVVDGKLVVADRPSPNVVRSDKS